MAKASTNPLQDFHDDKWPKGLFCRVDSFRFKRHYRKIKISEVWGAIPERAAINKATRWNLDIEEGRNPAQTQKRESTTFRAFADHWLLQKKASITPASLQKYKSVLDTFQEFLAAFKRMPECPLTDVNYAVAQDFVTARQAGPIFLKERKGVREAKGGASKKTVLCDREVLWQLFDEARKRKDILENPFADIRVAKPKTHEILKKHHPMTEHEEKSLLRAIEQMEAGKHTPGTARFYDIVEFMLKTGMRETEVRYLEWSDIDWKRDLITVRGKRIRECRKVPIPPVSLTFFEDKMKKCAPQQALFSSIGEFRAAHLWLDIRAEADILDIQARHIDLKNRCITYEKWFDWKPKATQGDVPMCATVANMLHRLDQEKISNFVFPHDDGGSCRQHWLAMLKKATAKAEIHGNVRIHDLRHTCAVRLREKGVPLETIAGILRHSDIKETLIYAPYKIEEGRNAIKKLDGA